MTDSIDPLPQHRARKPKPTIADIVNDCVRTRQRPRAIRAIIRKLYPKAQWDDVKAAVTAEMERQAVDLGMTDENATSFPLPKPTMHMIRYATTTQAVEAGVPAKAIHGLIIAAAGKVYPEMSRDQLELELAEDIEQEEFWNYLDAARALDPDWYENEDHSFGPRPGALYDTPEKLVAAYRSWIGEEIPKNVHDAIRAYRAWRDGSSGSVVG